MYLQLISAAPVSGSEAGALRIAWRRRTLRVDADGWLALPANEPFALGPDAGDVPLLSVTVDAAPEPAPHGDASAHDARSHGFVGHLLPMDADAADGWQRIARARDDARAAADLVAAALRTHAALRRRAEGFGCARAATRDGLLERVLSATDFIASHYDEPIDLDRMAGAAHLSRFHFVRLFRVVHGETPHAFLLRKRSAVARRRLACGDGRADAATHAGFGSRSALFRNLRKGDPSGRGAAFEPCSRSA